MAWWSNTSGRSASCGLEVDFVAYGPGFFLAVEVKRTARIQRRDLAALKAFGANYPEAQRLLLSFCPEPLVIDGIRCEFLDPWLRALRPPFESAVRRSARGRS